jgi:hypothetical protein
MPGQRGTVNQGAIAAGFWDKLILTFVKANDPEPTVGFLVKVGIF